MADTSTMQGQHLLKADDFVKVVDAEGNELPPVPKHWGTELLAPGAKKTRTKATTADAGETARTEPNPAPTEPTADASLEEWATYARAEGATPADLLDSKGKPLSRDDLAAKYGS